MTAGATRSKRNTVWRRFCLYREKYRKAAEGEKVDWKPVTRRNGWNISSGDEIETSHFDGNKVINCENENDYPYAIVNHEILTRSYIKKLTLLVSRSLEKLGKKTVENDCLHGVDLC